MKKIVIIEQDSIVSNTMRKTLEKYKEEKIRVDIFSSLDAFRDKYVSGDVYALQNSEVEDPQIPMQLGTHEAHFEIDIIAIADEFLGTSPAAGIDFLVQKMQELELSSAERPCRFMILGYYYDDLHLQDYIQNSVVDFLFKPLDEQLLLQKFEVAFKLGQKIEPSFLAKASIKEPIAIGKQGKIEELSEFGLAIRNPKPIKPGQFARFYSKVFFCKESPSLLARCYMNIPHPEYPGEFLVYFSYFGIRREQLLHVRKTMQRDTALKKSYFHNEAIGSAPTSDNSSTEKHIVVIDNDPSTARSIEEIYKANFNKVKVHAFTGYTNFMAQLNEAKRYKNPLDEFNKLHGLGIYSQVAKVKKKKKKKDAPETPTLSERYRAVPMEDRFQFEINKEDQKMFRMELSSHQDYDCFGYSLAEMKENGEIWRSFVHEYSREEFEEFLEICMAGQQGRIEIWGQSKDSSPARLRVEAKPKPRSVQLSIMDISHQYRHEANRGDKDRLGKIFAIYMDGAMIRSEDKPAFLQNLRSAVKKAGLKPDKRKTKINIIGMEGTDTRAGKFEFEEVDDFFYRPIDRNLLLQKMLLYVFPFEDEIAHIQLDYFQNSHSSVLSTDVEMIEVSEHGIGIRYKIPFKEGTFMRFISQIFYLDNGDPLIGRCYYSEKEEDGSDYISYFEFFGVTDEVFKRIRVWIRESYIRNKQKSSA